MIKLFEAKGSQNGFRWGDNIFQSYRVTDVIERYCVLFYI